MTEKTLSHWLIIDWKNEKTRTRKTQDDGLGPYEIQTKLELDVVVPDVDVDELAAVVEVPTPKVHSAVVEAIDGEDLLPWQKAVHEAVYDAIEDDETQGMEVGDDAYDSLVESLAYRAMVNTESPPPAAMVHDAVENLLFEEVADE